MLSARVKRAYSWRDLVLFVGPITCSSASKSTIFVTTQACTTVPITWDDCWTLGLQWLLFACFEWRYLQRGTFCDWRLCIASRWQKGDYSLDRANSASSQVGILVGKFTITTLSIKLKLWPTLSLRSRGSSTQSASTVTSFSSSLLKSRRFSVSSGQVLPKWVECMVRDRLIQDPWVRGRTRWNRFVTRSSAQT